MGYKHVLGNSSMQHDNLWFQNEFFQKKNFWKIFDEFLNCKKFLAGKGTSFWNKNIVLELLRHQILP